MEEVGRVVAVYGRNVIRFAVPEEKMENISRPGTYVKVEGPGGTWLYAMVVSFNLLDELYRRSRIVEELEGYLEFRPARNELIATLVGHGRDRSVKRGVPVLPKPGQKVYVVPREELKQILGDGDIDLGTLSYDSEIPFKLKLNMLCSRHFAVLAMTGAGKSNAVAVILASILSRYPYARIVLIDTHSEYVPLKEKFGDKVRVLSPIGKIGRLVEVRYDVKPQPLEIPLWTLGLEELASLLRLGPQATKQIMYLRNALQAVRRRRYPIASTDDPIFFRADELRNEIEVAGPSRDKSLLDLVLKFESLLENSELFYITRPRMSDEFYDKMSGGEPQRSVKTYLKIFGDMLKPGINIIALGGLPSEAQASTAATILRSLWRVIGASVLAGHRIPVLIIVEEAHAYAPQGKWSPARDILEKIAKEGRKFGVGLGVVSQRPRELSQTLLAQCGTLIALRTSNPEDQRHIMRSMEDIMNEMVEGLSGLGTGEALVSGPAAPLPAIVKVHHFPEIYGVSLGGKDVDWATEWSSTSELVDLTPYIVSEVSPESGGNGGEKEGTLEKFLGGKS